MLSVALTLRQHSNTSLGCHQEIALPGQGRLCSKTCSSRIVWVMSTFTLSFMQSLDPSTVAPHKQHQQEAVCAHNSLLHKTLLYIMGCRGLPRDAGLRKAIVVLQVIRHISTEYRSALDPHWPALLPSLCSIAQDTAGPTKMATDRTLSRILSLDQSMDKVHAFLASRDAVSLVRGYLSEAKLRALAKLTPETDDIL